MSQDKIKYRGLCSTCKHSECGKFPRDPNKPVLYCEEFEIGKTSSITPPGKEQPLVSGPTVIDEDSTKFIGLCSDCEGRQTCTFPKSEGGIWHCEEYR